MLYGARTHQWQNRWGQIQTLDGLAGALAISPLGEGDCYGTHRLIAMTIVQRMNREQKFLEPKTAESLHQIPQSALRDVTRRQRPDGAWSPGWFLEFEAPSDQRAYDGAFTNDRVRLAHATGHLLEWLFLLPADLTPQPSMIERALAWCVAALTAASPEEIQKNLCPYSHCFRAVRRAMRAEADGGAILP